MIPIRPIDEELCRLHQPMVTAEEDDSCDTALQGFSVTSVVSRPEMPGGSGRYSYSDSSWSITPVVSPSSVISPAYYHPRAHHHVRKSLVGSYGYTTNNVVYPVTATAVESFRPYPHHVRYSLYGSPSTGSPGGYARTTGSPRAHPRTWM